MIRLELIIRALYISVVISSCSADKNIDDIIETRTNLTSIEIINFIPNNSTSISSGYTRESLNKMDYETYSKINDDFPTAETNNRDLYFDSLKYEITKKVDNLNFYNQKQLVSIINNNFKKLDTSKYLPSKSEVYFMGIIYYNEYNLLATLEVPTDYSLNWSIIKIWSFDPVKRLPQIHSVLIAKANSFDYINIKNQNLYLGDGDFIYRIVLDEEYRFAKDMDVFVSMDIHQLLK